MNLADRVKLLYAQYGQRKAMGKPALSVDLPHYFLIRSFLGKNDLLIIFNTKRCKYQCDFCQLPAKCSRTFISSGNILRQFEYVLFENKHALSILDSITISNEGSILDENTFPKETLFEIAKCINELRRVRKFVIESRLEFVNRIDIKELKKLAPRVTINILTGFETLSNNIREQFLNKKETISSFLNGMDEVAASNAELTAYILYKPDPRMDDQSAFIEAENSIDFLITNCKQRNIPLSIRINPVYLAKGSKWTKYARSLKDFQPPKLTDIMHLAEKKSHSKLPIYIGLSTEGLEDNHTNYKLREDFSSGLIKPIILFNNRKILKFNWKEIDKKWMDK